MGSKKKQSKGRKGINMARSCCKTGEGTFPPSWQNPAYPQRRRDGELGLETISWDALITVAYHSYFSAQVFDTDSVAPGQNKSKEGKDALAATAQCTPEGKAPSLVPLAGGLAGSLSAQRCFPTKPFSTEMFTRPQCLQTSVTSGKR